MTKKLEVKIVDRRLLAMGKNLELPLSCFLHISNHLESICKILFLPVASAGSPVTGTGIQQLTNFTPREW